VFRHGITCYLENTDAQFIATLSDNLKLRPLEQWNEYASAISSYNIFGDRALEIVKESLAEVCSNNMIEQ